MFKKLDFKRLNYRDLERYDSHDLKRDEMHSFYLTFDFLDLIKKWPEIIGPKFAPVSSPLKIKGDTLFIITKHPSISEGLSYVAEEIKKQIFTIFPNLRPIVKKIAYQTQEGFFIQKAQAEKKQAESIPSQLHPQSPQYKKLMIEAEKLFNDVPDEELRSILISIYIQGH